MTVSVMARRDLAPMPEPRQSGTGRLRVLVLDDDEADRMALLRMLGRAGLEAEATELGEVSELMPALDRQSFDIVFVDYWLGFETGLDAVALLAAHAGQNRAAAIMLSRATEPHVIVEAMRSGCADYIVKDELSIDTVRACIASAFERRILLAGLRESREMRAAIRRLVDRLSQGRVRGLAEAPADFAGKPTDPALARIDSAVARRLSAGLLADLERLWQLRRG
ncbi:response regulator [Rhodobacterales bacterium HKCCE2091]|nr:response regulator [Rhodobacterales bacterium HKCCE2091]